MEEYGEVEKQSAPPKPDIDSWFEWAGPIHHSHANNATKPSPPHHPEDRLQIELDQWMQAQGTRFPRGYDRTILKHFIRGTKFNMERAKRALEAHFVARHDHPELYTNRDPQRADIVKAATTVNIVPLPKLTSSGDRLLVFQIRRHDEFDMLSSVRLFFMTYDILLTMDRTVNGDIAIFDCNELSPKDAAQFLCAAFRTCVALLRKAYAVRLKQIHVVNAPAMVDKVVAAIKPLLSDTVRHRFVVHRDAMTLRNHFDDNALPYDFGGTAERISELMDTWYQDVLVKKATDWFAHQESVKIVTVNNRTTHSTPIIRALPSASSVSSCAASTADLVGVDGTFRQLTID